MKFKFPQKLILGSMLALGIASFTACGDSNNSVVTPGTPSSSSMDVPPLPPPTATTAILFNEIAQTQTVTKIKFSGTISLDLNDTATVADVNAVHFTRVDFVLHSATQVIPTSMLIPPVFETNQVNSINLLEIGLMAEPTECGPMTLIYSASATDGTKESVSIDSLLFDRDASFCVVEESSSSEAGPTEVPLNSYQVTLNTKTMRGLMLETGTPVADITTADLIITANAGSVSATFNNGIRVAEDTSEEWFDKRLPPAPTTTSFLYRAADLTNSIPTLGGMMFYIAVTPTYNVTDPTGAGYYAFTVLNETIIDEKDKEVTLIVYKAGAVPTPVVPGI